jgi:hypothetical protein
MRLWEYFVFRPTSQPAAELYKITPGWLWGAMWNNTASWTTGDSLLLPDHYEISVHLEAADCFLQALYLLVMLSRDVKIFMK